MVLERAVHMVVVTKGLHIAAAEVVVAFHSPAGAVRRAVVDSCM